MFIKAKKGEDSLLLLQRDLNQLAFAHYEKVKQAKSKAKRKNEIKKKKIQDQESCKFPSLYQSPNSKNKLNSLNNHHSSLLLQKIQQFENRINDLQAENSIHKRQNEKLIDDIIKLRTNHKSLYESYQPQSPMMSPPAPYYQQMPYSPSPFMPNMMSPYQNYPSVGMNPYLNQMQGPSPFEKQKSKLYGKTNRKYKNVNKFRVAGLAVFFSIFFPKYAKSFTVNRFDDFKENWKEDAVVDQARQNMKQYLLQHVSLSIFQTINELDQYKQADEEEETKTKKKNVKNKGKPKKKVQSSDDEDSDSDQQSSQSSKSQEKSDTNQREQKNKGDQKVFQFYLKLDVSVNFIVEFIKQVTKTIASQEFIQKNPYLMLFLSRQFQSDMLNEQNDFKYINFHPVKGYSQNERIVTEYLLVKNILLDIFVQGEALNEFGKKYFLTESANEQLQNRVFFSFFIRTTLMKKMINQYASKKIQKAKTFPLPKQQLLPFPKIWNNTNPLQEGAITFQNNGLKMDQNSIHQISAAEVKKKQKQMRNLLDQFCEKLYKNLLIFRRKKYLEISDKTIKQKYRTQQTDYFHLHQKGEKQKLMQSMFTKTSKTQFEKTQKSIRGKNNGDSKTLLKTSSQNKQNKKMPKPQPKKKVAQKKSKSSDESSSSQSD